MKAFLFFALLILNSVSAGFASEQRIVSLSPATTEWAYALGKGANIVGRTSNCDFPASALKLPSVGRFLSPNMEALLKLKPTLVLATDNFSSKRLQEFTKLGVKVFVLKTKSLAGLAESALKLGSKLGAHEKAKQITAKWNLAAKAKPKKGAALKSFLAFIDLQSRYVASQTSFVGSVFEKAGYANLVKEANPFPQMAFPWFLSHVPQVAFLFDSELKGSKALVGFKNQPASKQLQLKKFWVGSVQRMNVVSLPADLFLRPGPRISDALLLLQSLSKEQP